MKDPDADRLVEASGPANLMRYYQVAQAILGVAFMPDVLDDAKVKKKVTAGENPAVLTSAA